MLTDGEEKVMSATGKRDAPATETNGGAGDATSLALKRAKRVDPANEAPSGGCFDFSSPREMFASLIAPTMVETFFEEYWEKKPMILTNRGERFHHCYPRLFGRARLSELLHDPSLDLIPGRDFVACRYVDGERRDLVAADVARAAVEERATVQFHQPQRFCEDLWRVQEKLEGYFGCLVGANAYVTHGDGSQGLAPHHDDVEVFVVHCEGEKRWRLYAPTPLELPLYYSGDLCQEAIGSPIAEFTLTPGDLLYMPRGTIHQAVAAGDAGGATHVTLSTYQQHTWGRYLSDAFPRALRRATGRDVALRRGLPRQLDCVPDAVYLARFKEMTRRVLDEVATATATLQPIELMEEFAENRLPPYQCEPQTETEEIPSFLLTADGLAKASIRFRFPDHMTVIRRQRADDEDDDEDEDEEEEEEEENGEGKKDGESNRAKGAKKKQDEYFVQLYHSLNNSRVKHMMTAGGEDSDDEEEEEEEEEEEGNEGHMQTSRRATKTKSVIFPADYQGALSRLRDAGANYTPLSELLDGEHRQRTLVCSLWEERLIEPRPTADAE